MTKFHLPHPAQITRPLCGRQVFNHRLRVSQDQDGIQLASDAEWVIEWHKPKPKACRFCARLAGFLPPLERKVRSTDEDENEQVELVERELTEEEDEVKA